MYCYKELLKMYIENYKAGTPIFIEEIKRFFKGVSRTSEEYEVTIRKVYVSINRLVKKGELNSFSDGIYYKGHITKEDVIKKKYIENDGDVFGYYVGDFIVSNVCKRRRYYNKTLGVWVKKSKVEVTCENYKYLELLDKIKLGSIGSNEIDSFISLECLEYKELFRYARVTKNKNAFMVLYNM